MVRKSTLFLLTGLLHACFCGDPNAPHQERQSRLLPNYEPFQHPAKKMLPSLAAQSITGPRTSGNYLKPAC